MIDNRDFEVEVSSMSTLEKECSNARGCNTENNLVLRAKVMAKGVVEVCLASASRPMKEKGLARSGSDSRNDSVKGSMLVRIEIGNTLGCKLSLLLSVVLSMFCKKRVAK